MFYRSPLESCRAEGQSKFLLYSNYLCLICLCCLHLIREVSEMDHISDRPDEKDKPSENLQTDSLYKMDTEKWVS